MRDKKLKSVTIRRTGMKRITLSLGILVFVFGLFLALPTTSYAQKTELKEGMTQGDFAMWLVSAIGAESKLPPAYGAEEAIKFLTDLGAIPEEGWQKGEEMTKELLTNLLEDPKEGANLSWDELVKKVRDHIQNIFDKRKLGVFRVLSSTPSLPAV